MRLKDLIGYEITGTLEHLITKELSLQIRKNGGKLKQLSFSKGNIFIADLRELKVKDDNR